MRKTIQFKNNNYVDSQNVAHKRTLLSTILDTLLGRTVPSWKTVNWSGNNTGGAITTNLNMTGKLVCLKFKASTNDYHFCYCTFYWAGTNNYLIANMYNVTQYVIANLTTTTGFTLTIPTTIKLDAIHYLDI